MTEERHRIIRARLVSDGRVLAADLASAFGVSEDTVRRDLRELARAGACRRVYGGALPLAPDLGPAPVRARLAPAEKAALAAAAVQLIAPGATVFIDAGTTNAAVAAAIPPSLSLTVATNCLAVAGTLSRHPGVRLLLLGGRYDPAKDACVGSDTVDAVRRLRADLCFLGACGLDAHLGATAQDPAEAEVKRAMAAASRRLAVAATTDKLGTAAAFAVAAPEAIGDLVVSPDAPAETLTAFARLGTVIHRA
ncbi:MAG: DeoR/GlpR family DNA-binding transcription regulator [Amaricoccus sp.]|uniref:DeoR/GlpR family DNA-binding transcription regulator n=1 Tax=Amaricoccus sp. TaxID=1872485 RepID=UPI0039E6EF54